MGQGASDPVIDEVRAVRHRISARVGHDPTRLVAYYIELQQQYQGRLIGAPETGGTAALAEAESSLTRGCSGPAEPGR